MKNVFSYAWGVHTGLCVALMVSVLVMAFTILDSWNYKGYELNTTIHICGGLAGVLFAVCAFKITQGYIDYKNGNSR